ncbi:MAG: succinate dehydrogenase, cytochrome b556 subunit [Paraglaciecola sp.]|nr:succinate dehydrogenase, cytochrome b556 subunit [Paraglaciecola sp.]
MKKKRPVNLDFTTMSLPIMGIASILHRVSAVIIWVAMAFLLPVLYISLDSPEGFDRLSRMATESFIAQFFIWGFMTAMGYYAMGGLKHMIQELGYFEDLKGGMLISKIAIGLGIVISFLIGVRIWA